MVGNQRDNYDSSLDPTTTVVGEYLDERMLKEEFAKVIGDYTAEQIAAAGGVGIDAAKKWLARKSLPNTASTFNLSRRLPVVRRWALRKMGVLGEGGGQAQVEVLRQIVADEDAKRPPAPSAVRRDAAVGDLFERRRA